MDAMRILIDSGAYDCRNMGDMAMLKVAIKRLHGLWPEATLHVLTAAPAVLAAHCPDVVATPVAARELWFAEHSLLGELNGRVPAGVLRGFAAGKRWLRQAAPGLLSAVIEARTRLAGADVVSPRDFSRAFATADLIVFSGQASFNDLAEAHSRAGLELLATAIARGTPTALVAQGLGPLSAPALVEVARHVLPLVTFVSVRERITALPLLAGLGVATERVPVTGDDAIELAFSARPQQTGTGVGVNVRLSGHQALPEQVRSTLRTALQSFAGSVGAELIGVPIVQRPGGTNDARHIAGLIEGYAGASDDGSSLSSPEAVIAAVGRCRVVLTGAYHSAVFALSQGIPVVCLPTNEYTMNKFRGLADQFGGGVHIVPLQTADLAMAVRGAMEAGWNASLQERRQLLDAAQRQIDAGQDAYAMLQQRIEALGKAA